MKNKMFLLVMFLLFLVGCRTTKETTNREHFENNSKADSVNITVEKTVKSITTPQTTAKLDLTTEQLEELPIGAQYQSNDKNATATIRKTEDNKIEFTANCDSLTILVQELKTEVYHLNSKNTALKTKLNEQTTVEVNKLTGLQWFQIYGFRIYLLLTIIYIIYQRWKIK